MDFQRDYFLESCVVSLDQALVAYRGGADRLEVCARLETEGMTPEPQLVSAILKRVRIPVRVMIRESPAGFECDDEILVKMISSIEVFHSLSIDGFVFGLLKNQVLDRVAVRSLMNACVPFPITIHKAIDLSQNIEDDILWLNQFPQVDTMLTAGGAAGAEDGMDQIMKMKSWFKGDIMAGGKITQQNLRGLHDRLHLKWYHGRDIVRASETR